MSTHSDHDLSLLMRSFHGFFILKGDLFHRIDVIIDYIVNGHQISKSSLYCTACTFIFIYLLIELTL